MECLSLQGVRRKIQCKRICRILDVSSTRLEWWLRQVDSQTSSVRILHFHGLKVQFHILNCAQFNLPIGTSPRFSHILDDILKSTGSISCIDLNPNSSVVIYLINGIPVIMKTMHCTDLVYLSLPFTWNEFAVLKNLSCWQATSSKEFSASLGPICKIVSKVSELLHCQ